MIDVPSLSRHALEATSPLSVRDLTVTYDRKPVLFGVDYDAPVHGLTAVVGPNGAGKSTFLKAVLGLVPTIAGDVTVFGRPVREVRGDIAYVPQRESVDWDFPASALDVVAMGLYGRIGWLGRVTLRHRSQALEQLDRVGLADLGDRQIGQLSGGQQQRVFIARALAQDAKVYLMDEPFAGVDVATEEAILETLRSLQQEGRTVIVVHHDLDTVSRFFDHALVLNVRRIADGPVDEALSPENLREAYGGRLATVRLPDLAQAG